MLPVLVMVVSLMGDSAPEEWLERVAYIISAREKEEYQQLQTAEERRQFIERFWRRRDPDSSTVVNEYKEEFERRIAYANERFGDGGTPGWKTARGRAYIIHGPPDDVRYSYGYLLRLRVDNPTRILNPQGENLPFMYIEFPTPESETWVYRYMPGSDTSPVYFTIIFAKMDATELYVLQRFISRTGGQSAAGAAGGANERRRIRDQMIKEFLTKQNYFRGDYRIVYAGDPRFFDLEDLLKSIFSPRGGREIDPMTIQRATAELYRSPGELLEERERRRRRMEEMVSSRIFFEQIPVRAGFGFLRFLKDLVRVPLRAEIQLPFREKRPQQLEIFAEMVDQEGRSVVHLQDTVPLKGKLEGDRFYYQSRFMVRPGRYQMRVLVSDLEHQRVGWWSEEVEIPDLPSREFGASELIFCEKVLTEKEALQLAGGGHQSYWMDPRVENPLAFDEYIFLPSTTFQFRRGQDLTTLLQVYNPTLVADKPQVRIQAVLEKGGEPVYATEPSLLDYTTGKDGNTIVFAFSLPLRQVDLGEYDFVVKVTDTPSGKTIQKRRELKIW